MNLSKLKDELVILQKQHMLLVKKQQFYDSILNSVESQDLEKEIEHEPVQEHDIDIKLPDPMEQKLQNILKMAKDVENETSDLPKTKKSQKTEEQIKNEERNKRIKNLEKAYIVNKSKKRNTVIKNPDKITNKKDKEIKSGKKSSIKNNKFKTSEESKATNLYDAYKVKEDIQIIIKKEEGTVNPLIKQSSNKIGKKILKFLMPLNNINFFLYPTLNAELELSKYGLYTQITQKNSKETNSTYIKSADILQIKTLSKILPILEKNIFVSLKYSDIKQLISLYPVQATELFILSTYLYKKFKLFEKYDLHDQVDFKNILNGDSVANSVVALESMSLYDIKTFYSYHLHKNLLLLTN